MKKSFKFVSIFSLTALLPALAFAEVPGPCGAFTGLGGVMCKIQELFSFVIPVLIALGVVYFVWGVVQYVIYDEEEAKKKGRDTMIYGIIGLTVVIGLWGLVYIVVDTFNIEQPGPSNTELQNLLPK